jgi:hypothetical protein
MNALLCFSISHPLIAAKRKSRLRGGGVVDLNIFRSNPQIKAAIAA